MAETLSLTTHPSKSYYSTRLYRESNPSNAYTSASSTTYAAYNASGYSTNEYYVEYEFDLSTIPQDSKIINVYCTAKCRSQGFTTNQVTLHTYVGIGSDKGTPQSYSAGSIQTVTIEDCGEWTREELSKLRLCFRNYATSQSGSRYIYIYGADLTIEYQEVTTGVIGQITIDGAQKEIVAAYANIGGTWKEITESHANIGGTWKAMN